MDEIKEENIVMNEIKEENIDIDKYKNFIHETIDFATNELEVKRNYMKDIYIKYRKKNDNVLLFTILFSSILSIQESISFLLGITIQIEPLNIYINNTNTFINLNNPLHIAFGTSSILLASLVTILTTIQKFFNYQEYLDTSSKNMDTLNNALTELYSLKKDIEYIYNLKRNDTEMKNDLKHIYEKVIERYKSTNSLMNTRNIKNKDLEISAQKTKFYTIQRELFNRTMETVRDLELKAFDEIKNISSFPISQENISNNNYQNNKLYSIFISYQNLTKNLNMLKHFITEYYPGKNIWTTGLNKLRVKREPMKIINRLLKWNKHSNINSNINSNTNINREISEDLHP